MNSNRNWESISDLVDGRTLAEAIENLTILEEELENEDSTKMVIHVSEWLSITSDESCYANKE